MRLIVTHESVIPQKDVFSRPPRSVPVASPALGKPAVKSLIRIFRQDSFGGKSDHFLHQCAKRRELQQCICDSRQRAADFAEQIRPADNSLAQSKAVLADRSVKQLRFEQRQIHVRGAFRRTAFARETIAQCRVQLFRLESIFAILAPL